MKLIWKFNLVLLGIFVLGFLVAGYISYKALQTNAREEILQNARLMMEAALSTRNYTTTQVKPLLETQMKYQFLPQTVPAYAATEQFNELRKKHPDYTYKEATLNPTNPRNRAADWEADVVNMFRNTAATTEVIGERDTPAGRSLYLSRPIQIKSKTCLDCHSTVEAAPKTMLDLYGSANGFGWRMEEVIGAQIVSVPMAVPTERANKAFTAFMGSLAIVFIAIFVLLNIMLYTMVIRRVTHLAGIADQVSLGQDGRGRVQDAQQGRDRRADRGHGPDEGEPRAGDEDARRMMRPMPRPCLPPANALMAEPERLGKYTIKGVLGKGAMGVVYRGFDPGIERDVAIKTIRKDLVEPELAAQYMARFKNEAKAAGRLHHPNIVGIYEYGEADDVTFIAMEYVEGTGLRAYLNARTSFDFAQLVMLMSQLLDALELRACPRRRPSRHQAVQPDHHQNGHAEGGGLRRGARRHLGPDRRRHGDRHAFLHVARAVPRSRGGPALGPVQRGCRVL